MPKKLFKGSCYKMQRLKNYFLANLYFFYRDSKIKNKNMIALRFIKLEMFCFLDIL